jgi:hypothetical protein
LKTAVNLSLLEDYVAETVKQCANPVAETVVICIETVFHIQQQEEIIKGAVTLAATTVPQSQHHYNHCNNILLWKIKYPILA